MPRLLDNPGSRKR